MARGEDDDRSDIDLLVDLDGERSAGSELLEVLGLSVELSELLDARVDVVTPRTLRPDVRELALAEAVPLPRTGEAATLAVPDDPPADS